MIKTINVDEYEYYINALERAKIGLDNRKSILQLAIYFNLKETPEYKNILNEYIIYTKLYNQEKENFKINCLDKIIDNNFNGTWTIDFELKEVTFNDNE